MMKISPEIIKHIKSNIPELHKVLDIVPNKNKRYTVHYISISQWGNNAPKFYSSLKEMNLRIQMRDSLIEELLSCIGEYKPEFDIEDVIYTEEQRSKLESLRNPVTKVDTWKELKKVKKEWSESFKLGQKVYYNNNHGLITFLHTQKEDDDFSRYTIKCNDIEYLYTPWSSNVTFDNRFFSNKEKIVKHIEQQRQDDKETMNEYFYKIKEYNEEYYKKYYIRNEKK